MVKVADPRSEVFRDFGLLSSASKHRLVLTEDFETSPVLSLYLAFIVSATFTLPGDGTTLDSLILVKHLIQFLRKYACHAPLKLLLLTIREVTKQPSSMSPLVGFIAGAIAEDAYTCSSSLDVGDWTWDMMRIPGSGLGSANVFDPHHMPVSVWQMIPGMYTWALTTAWKGEAPTAVRRMESEMSMSSLGSLRYGYASQREDRRRFEEREMRGDGRGERVERDGRGERTEREGRSTVVGEGSVHGSSVSRARRSQASTSRHEPDVQRKVYAWQQWL